MFLIFFHFSATANTCMILSPSILIKTYRKILEKLLYRNDPTFSDRYAWANSADPNQTALEGSSLIRVYTVCHSTCIIWTHYSMIEPHSSNFRVITTNFWVSEYLGNLR